MLHLHFHPWSQPEAFEVEVKQLDDTTHILRFTKDHSGKVFATIEQLAQLRDALTTYIAEFDHD